MSRRVTTEDRPPLQLLREDVLCGVQVGVAGAGSATLRGRLEELGAAVEAGDAQELQALLVDARGWFAGGGEEALRRTLASTWEAVAPAACRAMIPGSRGGRILLLAPPPQAGRLARAARDAMENLARTLSIEWARFSVTTVAIAPGERTAEAELAELIAFLLSDAGGYFSGCRLDLR